MRETEVVDILFGLILTASIPFLVFHYLKRPRFSNQFIQLAMLGGVLWMGYSFFAETLVYSMLGVQPADTVLHWRGAVQQAEALGRGRWPFDGVFLLSNQAYKAYLAFLHLFTGCSAQLAITINGWLAFWGGLVLVRNLGDLFPERPSRSIWFLLLLFFPSTVFWCTGNLKEGMMYWSICQMTTLLFRPLGLISLLRMPWTLAGIALAAVLRPHVCAIWLCSVAGAALVQRRQKALALALLIFVLPLAIGALEKLVGRELDSASDMIEVASKQARGLSRYQSQGSNIDYGESGAVFFVSGFTALFLRPFPWEIRNARTLVSAIETWSVTLLIAWGWIRLRGRDRRMLARLPSVQMAVLACLGFSIFFTFLPNEGLMVRQRVQVVPALLILAVFPYLHAEMIRVHARRAAQWRADGLRAERAQGAR